MIDKKITVILVLTILAVGLVYPFQTGMSQPIEKLRVVFHRIGVHNNHEGFLHGSGEWKLNAQVNDKRVDLSASGRLDNVWAGRTIWLFDRGVDIDVPTGGKLTIVTYGAEKDAAELNLPHIDVPPCEIPIYNTTNGGNYIGLACLVIEAWNAVAFVTSLDQNDPLGTIGIDFGPEQGYGVGSTYWIQSSQTDGESDTKGDYDLQFSIVRLNPAPSGALTAELFTGANYGGQSVIATHDSPYLGPDFGQTFQDSITSVKVRPGPNYVIGDTLHLCEDANYGGRCLVLGPGDYDVGAPMVFNDQASSLRFIR